MNRVNGDELSITPARVSALDSPVVVLAGEDSEFVLAACVLLKILQVPFSRIDAPAARDQPEIYIADKRIGNAEDLFQSYISGELHSLLRKAGINPVRKWHFDPAHLLLQQLLTSGSRAQERG